MTAQSSNPPTHNGEDLAEETVVCPACGSRYAASRKTCPFCTIEMQSPFIETTRQIERAPTLVPSAHSRNSELDTSSAVVLQFLPSGTCLALDLEASTILGRRTEAETPFVPDLVDLTNMGAARCGVSRRHCLLRRDANHLHVTDLGSTNGTYLNGDRLAPNVECSLADGDRLILGTLHLAVFFQAAVSVSAT